MDLTTFPIFDRPYELYISIVCVVLELERDIDLEKWTYEPILVSCCTVGAFKMR